MKWNHQQLREAALAQSRRWQLPLRGRLWSGRSGEFAGKGMGASLDFQDHRDYAPGDDPRHINWQAYASSGNYLIKQYREEVSPTVEIILDTSSSMFLNDTKGRRSLELFYLFLSLAESVGAQVRVHLQHELEVQSVEKDAAKSDLWWEAVLQKQKQASRVEHSVKKADLSAITFLPGSLRVWISDLLFEADPTAWVRPVTERQGVLMVVVPFAQVEARPDWRGQGEFRDVESGERLTTRVDERFLKTYQASYARHFSLWEQAVRSAGGEMGRVSDSESLEASLLEEVVPRRLLAV